MRSKTLLVSSILSTIYALCLLWTFGGVIVSAGGIGYIYYWRQYFDALFALAGYTSVSVSLIYAIVILLLIHIAVFTLGALMGWIGYMTKKSGLAKFAAVLYLVGTTCFPVFILAGLPLTIVGFVGAGRQKKMNAGRISV